MQFFQLNLIADGVYRYDNPAKCWDRSPQVTFW